MIWGEGGTTMYEPTKIVTYADAGRILGISRSAVWKLAKRGSLATCEVRGRRYALLEAVKVRLEVQGDIKRSATAIARRSGRR
jgi:hypothetical protein